MIASSLFVVVCRACQYRQNAMSKAPIETTRAKGKLRVLFAPAVQVRRKGKLMDMATETGEPSSESRRRSSTGHFHRLVTSV